MKKLSIRTQKRIDREIKNDRPLSRIKNDLAKEGVEVTRWYLSQRKAALTPKSVQLGLAGILPNVKTASHEEVLIRLDNIETQLGLIHKALLNQLPY